MRPGQEIARRAIRCHAVYSEATEEQAVHEDREVQDVKPPAIASLKVRLATPHRIGSPAERLSNAAGRNAHAD